MLPPLPCSMRQKQLKHWLVSYRQVFQHACFHLIDLMRIDCHSGFSCRCVPRWHTADAIPIGMNSNTVSLSGRMRPPPAVTRRQAIHCRIGSS
jgi:hypothetical protein